MRIVSWNLLRLTGATVGEVIELVEREQPDLLLMQEATGAIDALPNHLPGHYARAQMPGRIHGPAMWTRLRLAAPPSVLTLPPGSLIDRVCQLIDLGAFSVANVHLSHGQLLNRRQLRHIARALPPHAAVIGDYNLVGPVMVPGFRDVGPRKSTHRAGDLVPVRLDRCIVRGLGCAEARVLPWGASDHRPILVRLAPSAPAMRAAERIEDRT